MSRTGAHGAQAGRPQGSPLPAAMLEDEAYGRDKPGQDAGENGLDMIGIRHAMRPPLVRPILARTIFVSVLAALCAVVSPAASAEQSPIVHHDLAVTLDPADHRLKVRDRIHVPGALVTAPFTISLNADLKLQAASAGPTLTLMRSRVPGSDAGMDRDDHDLASRVPMNVYRVEDAVPGQELTAELDYEGAIAYPIRQSGGEYARAFAQSPGLIESRGVYLAGSTHWVARVADALMTYTLAVELP